MGGQWLQGHYRWSTQSTCCGRDLRIWPLGWSRPHFGVFCTWCVLLRCVGIVIVSSVGIFCHPAQQGNDNGSQSELVELRRLDLFMRQMLRVAIGEGQVRVTVTYIEFAFNLTCRWHWLERKQRFESRICWEPWDCSTCV